MSLQAYACDVCNAALPSDRARLHCRICPDYDSCADCYVTESVSGTHCVEHDYEVYMHDRPALVKGKTVVTSNDPEPSTYWGQLLTPAKTPSPIFSRLIAAIFAHFDATSAGVLQPSEFCALMFASGHTAEQFPPLQVSTNESASPADLHGLDAWLANWIRSFPLDHRMATREFPPPPPIEPVNGRIRMRDQFLHSLMYPEAPVVPNGQPLLSQLGLEQWFLHLLLHNPGSLCGFLNHLLGALPRLPDPETSRPFETQLIPRSCFPLIADPEAEERKRMVERHQMEEEQRFQEAKLQVQHNSAMLMMQAMRNVSGGWRTDSYGNRHYVEGTIR
ncbi:hypothetical protein C8A00DRAFT_19114 [Chaetomidium leptoderma]|uniref:ZZ-type domain-containing protein n=1 Tax=Chaetomidium leptoderma TaxID=669021 RepID=A0AAN6ZT69_9PEZI|nr:hypothetical protein C8A00DRAFT_19114 [Chaetomidium leptoderma]